MKNNGRVREVTLMQGQDYTHSKFTHFPSTSVQTSPEKLRRRCSDAASERPAKPR